MWNLQDSFKELMPWMLKNLSKDFVTWGLTKFTTIFITWRVTWESTQATFTGNIKNKITNYGLRPQASRSRIRVRTQILDPEGNSGDDFCKLQFSLKTNVQLLVTIILFIGFVQTFGTWEIHFVRRFFDF